MNGVQVAEIDSAKFANGLDREGFAFEFAPRRSKAVTSERSRVSSVYIKVTLPLLRRILHLTHYRLHPLRLLPRPHLRIMAA